MRLTSTRDESISASFEEAILSGLAPDGGLYKIDSPPDLSAIISRFRPETSFVSVASELTAALLGDELGAGGAREVCEAAYRFAPALARLDGEIDLLELFHGPSCAFKDFGASFLASAMERFLARSGRRTIILTATSGDTGSAVAQAFHRRDAIEVVILYPSGRVSPLQEQQLTTVGDNVHALEVDGAFDDCQRMAKEAFLDPELRRRLPLTSANSINIGRLLPQAFYYVYAGVAAGGPVTFCVPSGNFGNLTAGVMARRWGMECAGFIAATNINDVVPKYLESAVFAPRSSLRTYSNAMDVGNPSNFERLLAIFSGDHDRMARTISGAVVGDEETMEEIRFTWETTRRFICPHTAVGVRAARRFLERKRGSAAGGGEHPERRRPEQEKRRSEAGGSGRSDARRVVCLATAHPAKFGEVIEEAVGERPELPGRLAEAMKRSKSATRIDARTAALREFLLDRWG